jgi:hypothetical protein
MDAWKRDVERIRQATGLPIVYLNVAQEECEAVRATREQAGWEIVQSGTSAGRTWMVAIWPAQWPDAARALLPLLLAKPEQADSAQEQVMDWLTKVAAEQPASPPHGLERLWAWRERRVCFLLESSRSEGSFDLPALQPLLHDFFKGAPISLFPIHPAQLLLAVPVSALDGGGDAEDWLEWAFGLHDLISTELMENVRVILGPAVETPALLGQALADCLRLSRALQKYRPRVMVADCRHFPLERWAASLPSDTASLLGDTLTRMMPAPKLNREQIETLETLFARQLNVSDTARQLFLHRNTLLYRLDKLTEQTGLDPRQFPDAVLLQLFLLFRQH